MGRVLLLVLVPMGRGSSSSSSRSNSTCKNRPPSTTRPPPRFHCQPQLRPLASRVQLTSSRKLQRSWSVSTRCGRRYLGRSGSLKKACRLPAGRSRKLSSLALYLPHLPLTLRHRLQKPYRSSNNSSSRVSSSTRTPSQLHLCVPK